MNTWTVKTANQVTGGLSKPSKMPGRAFNTSAFSCITGSKLASVKGSACSICYARKGRYVFPRVQKALKKRELAFTHPEFVEAMCFLITKQSPDYFRWFDSGDLQSVDQLKLIVEICNRTPNTKHWLPTRETKIIKDFLLLNQFPDNLAVRISSNMQDMHTKSITGLSSLIYTNNSFEDTIHTCPSIHQGNKCLDCRACWDKKVTTVGYKKH